jgi:hypothetical protein
MEVTCTIKVKTLSNKEYLYFRVRGESLLALRSFMSKKMLNAKAMARRHAHAVAVLYALHLPKSISIANGRNRISR